MKFVTIKRFKGRGIGGQFNIPYGTPIDEVHGFLCISGKPICAKGSFMAHEHFARDDDNCGLTRGKITHAIIDMLGGFSFERNNRWDKIFSDSRTQKYRRADAKDFWLWDDDFFNAPLDDLNYLFALVKGA